MPLILKNSKLSSNGKDFRQLNIHKKGYDHFFLGLSEEKEMNIC